MMKRVKARFKANRNEIPEVQFNAAPNEQFTKAFLISNTLDSFTDSVKKSNSSHQAGAV